MGKQEEKIMRFYVFRMPQFLSRLLKKLGKTED